MQIGSVEKEMPVGATQCGRQYGMAPGGSMGPLRLIADDLTGALDTAARFASEEAPIDVIWRPCVSTAAVAVDVGTRELDPATAAQRVAEQVAAFPADDEACHFLKLDSLLRGNAAAEIAAWHATRPFDHLVLAPAFPRQGRVTRGGQQYWRDGESWVPTACDLAADLRAAGFALSLCRPGEKAPSGFSLWDAETDADLSAIADAGRELPGKVLWCGCGGLAGALAPMRGGASGLASPLARPVLGLFGTDHAVTTGQLDACDPHLLVRTDGSADSATGIAARLRGDGIALVRATLPEGLGRSEVARRIEATFAALLARLSPPATLLVAGGETLRAVCLALRADRLELVGQLSPGIPRAILRGGAFDGVDVVSKSGAFGARDALARLLAEVSPSAQGSRS